MVRVVQFSKLPIVAAESGDTLTAYRDGGVVRIPVPTPDGGGSVTSVGVSMPAGFEASNSPITSSGTITITFSEGYGLPTIAAMGEWSTAFSWGDHAQAGYALASAVASALAGKVGTDDVRLSDAREWSASTVPQAAAEAGTSTVRFAWTAQRVWQAIAAWWAGSAAKAKLDGIQAGSTANAADAYLLARANHTGTQAISTVAGLQSALDTKVGTSDVRLSDAREWSASTVTQGTAEAGTSTVRFAWTAQRVRQAIAAWWATITINAADVQGLGTAAERNAPAAGNAGASEVVLGSDTRLTNSREWIATTVSQVDAEAGTSVARTAWTAQRVRQAIAGWWQTITLTKADVGLGSVDNTPDSQKTVHSFIVSDTRNVVSVPNAVPARSGLFEFKLNTSVGSPPSPSTGNYSHVLTINGWTADGTGGWPTQISFGNDLAFRKGASATTWGDWLLLYHSGNAYSASEVDALISAATSGAWVWQATTTALPKNTPSKVDFSSPRTLTLPASPAENDYVAILKTAGDSTGSTIARNGQTIMGLAENMDIDTNINYLRLDFVNSSWRIAS